MSTPQTYCTLGAALPSACLVNINTYPGKGLVLGVAPALAAVVTGNDALLFFGLAHLGAATGDAVILWRLRGVPGAALVRDHGSRVGCVLLDEYQELA